MVGCDAALFRLFVTMSMFQALRDVVIMQQQRALPVATVRALAGLATVKRRIAEAEERLERRLGPDLRNPNGGTP